MVVCLSLQVLEGKPIFADCFGNLVPLTKSGQHHVFSFYAFKENRLSLFIKVSTLLFEGLFIVDNYGDIILKFETHSTKRHWVTNLLTNVLQCFMPLASWNMMPQYCANISWWSAKSQTGCFNRFVTALKNHVADCLLQKSQEHIAV